MIIHKSYKFRLYPNKEQQELIHKTFGCNHHYLYNKQTEYHTTKKSKSTYECIKNIPSLY